MTKSSMQVNLNSLHNKGGLSDQVFNTGQAQQPLPDGVGPAIVGINKGNVDPEQAHGGGLGMKLIKALMMG